MHLILMLMARSIAGGEIAQDDEREEQASRSGDEITRPYSLGMRLEEHCPVLTGWTLRSLLTHIVLDRPLGHMDPQFEQLSADPFCAPQGVLACHAPNQLDRVVRELRPSTACFALLFPDYLEALTVPAQQCRRLDDQ
jgi:hypothetical protein